MKKYFLWLSCLMVASFVYGEDVRLSQCTAASAGESILFSMAGAVVGSSFAPPVAVVVGGFLGAGAGYFHGSGVCEKHKDIVQYATRSSVLFGTMGATAGSIAGGPLGAVAGGVGGAASGFLYGYGSFTQDDGLK